MSKLMRVSFKLLDLLVIIMMVFGSPMSAAAKVWTDPTDYPPGSTVTIRGDNSDTDTEHNFLPGEIVHVDVIGPYGGYTLTCDAVADGDGAWFCDVTLSSDPALATGEYMFTATGQDSGNTETGTFTDAVVIGGFNIDGVVPDAGSLAFPDPFGATAELGPLNQNTTKLGVINTDPLPTLGYTSITPGNDLTTAWLQTKVDPDTGHVWLYFAFARASASTGVVAFEFEKNAAPVACNYAGVNLTDPPGANNTETQNLIANCNPFANRSVGDFMLVFDLQGQSLVIVKRTFLGDGLGFDSTNLDSTVSAAAFSGSGNQTGLTGEGAVDLTATVFGSTPNSCFSVANIIPMTITGNSDTADFKDVVLGDFSGTGISSCGTVKVTKVTDPAGGTGSFPYTLSRTDNSALKYNGDTIVTGTLTFDGDVDTISDLKQGTNYTLAEGSVGPDWALQTISCTTGTTTYNVYPGNSVFAVQPSTITTCTITNKQQTGTLTVIKHVVNDNGGTATANQWSLHVKSGSTEVSGSPQAGSEDGTLYTLAGGSYNVSETGGPLGYTFMEFSGDCDISGNVTVVAGQNKTCTLTNDDQPAHLTLVKEVTNDNGGTAAATDFTLSADGPTPISGAGGADSDVDAGTYDLSETSVDGYTTGSWSCVGGSQNGASITLANGESATCTITNDDNGAHLTLVKEVTNDNGGTAAATDFTLSADGPTPISGAGGADSDVDAGTYNLSEAGPSGYTASDWSCVGGSQNGASLTLALGESATCTITNDDNGPSLTLVKEVINDNGGTATENQWILTATGPTGFSGVGPSVSNGASFDAGTYDLSESGPSGYTASNWVCVGGTQDDGDTITVGLGESATCTITNDDNAPALYLVKHVVNDNGGDAEASDWTLSAGSNSVIGSETGVLATDQIGTYILSETSVDGYTNTSITCDNDPGVEVTSVTIGLGETIICTFVNDDDPASLILVKHVNSNNGGTANASDWTLSAGSNSVAGSETGVEATDQAGTYALSESSVTGYTNASITCNNNPSVEVTSVTLGLGETITCTFVNADDAPALYLVKHVVNDNGGDAEASDWTLSAGSNSVIGSETGVLATDQIGTYILSETSVDGYTNTSITCDNDPGVEVTSVTIGLGETIICTFVNDDDPASLILVKHVVNNNGGTEEASAWTLSAGSNSVTGSETGVEATDQAGTYDLSETSVDGYTNTSITCDNDPGVEVTSVTLGLGETITCTFVNDDDAASLLLVKHLVNDNGGTEEASAWTLSAGSNSVTGSETGVEATDQAGTYDLSETSVDGYTNTSITCDNSDGQVTSVTVGLGETVTCTFVNDDDAPSLILVKHVVNDNGGTALASTWTLFAGSHSITGSESGAEVTDQAGTYNLSESSVTGYTNTSITCDNSTDQVTSVTVDLGETITCTFINDDIAPSLTLNKVVVNNNGGTAAESNWTLTANGGAAGTLSGPGAASNADVVSDSTFKAGTYVLSESTGPSGYSASSWSCVNNGGAPVTGSSITLGLGDSATCTITNDDIAPQLKLIKTVTNDNGGTAAANDWDLTATGSGGFTELTPAATDATFQAVTAGVDYALSETGPNGYNASNFSCDGGTQVGNNIQLAVGQSVTCTINNNDIAPSLTLNKVVVNDNGGTALESAWTLTANGGTAGILTGPGAAGNADVVSGLTFKAGIYALSESTGPYGYTASSWSCVKNGGVPATGSSITLGLGDTATCTITNDDKPGTIVIIKNAKPQNGTFTYNTTGATSGSGTSWPAQFTLSGNPAGDANKTSFFVDTGTYTVKESTQLGWLLTGIGGSTDPNTPYNCVVTGSGGSTGVGDLSTMSVTIDIKNGDTVTCTFENTGQGVTRTQGFWATHTKLAEPAWFGGTSDTYPSHTFPGVAATIGDNLICGRPIDTLGKLMGGFWSDIAKKSTGIKRTALDQARMQLLQQLLAAELNASAFGSVPAGGMAKFGEWEAALCSTNQTAIKNAQQQAASFNSAGDSQTFTPGTSADSKYARSIANIPFWDIIKP